MSPALAWRGVIEEYRDYLPVIGATPVVTLLEGGTPLLAGPAAVRAGRGAGVAEARGRQPDRFVQGPGHDRGHLQGARGGGQGGRLRLDRQHLGVGRRLRGPGRADLRGADPGRLHRPRQAGPGPHPRRPGPADPGQLRRRPRHRARARRPAPVTVVNSINPYRIEGQKTGAFEIVDVLGDAPDVHCIPVGNAGNITAYWKGYREYQDAGRVTRLPRMLGFQAAGAAPIVLGHPVDEPETIATAIRIGRPASWYGATAAAAESGGVIDAVTDDEILDAYRYLAQEESVFCEPASAASVAGLLKVGVPAGLHGRVRAHRARAEGPRHRHRPDRGADGGRRRPASPCRTSWPCRAAPDRRRPVATWGPGTEPRGASAAGRTYPWRCPAKGVPGERRVQAVS